MNIGNRIKESTASTSTSSITLAGAPAGFRSFSAGFVAAATGIEVMVGPDSAGAWLIGVYTLTNATTLTRTAIVDSSASGADVTLAAGNKDVYNTVSAQALTAGFAGSGAVDITFSTTVPLLNPAGTFMTGLQSVTGPLTFTPAAGAVRGACTFAFLKANGVNVPDVSAFTEHGSSSGYLNTANIMNIANFFNLGGVNWVAWSQALNPVAIVTPTTVSLSGPNSGVVNTATSNYTVNTDGVRTSSVVVTPTPVAGVTFNPSSVTLAPGSAAGTFTATSSTTGSKTIAVTNNAGLTNPPSISLSVAAAASAPGAPGTPVATASDGAASFAFTAPASDGGSAITGYTLTVYKASDNSAVGTFTGTNSPIAATGLTNGTGYYGKVAATNSVGTGAQSAASNTVTPAAASIRFGTLSNVTEGGTAPAYTYTGGSGASNYSGTGISNLSTGTGDFTLTGRLTSLTNDGIIGLTTSASPVTYTGMAYGLWPRPTNKWDVITAGAPGTANPGSGNGGGGFIAPAVGNYFKLQRTGTNLVASYSTDGTTWVVFNTWTSVPATSYKVDLSINNGFAIDTLTTTGMS